MKDFRLNESSRGDILKQCDLCFQALANCINQSLVSRTFSDSLKLANISPVHKAKDPFDKTNSRPASVLSLLSKIYKILYFDRFLRSVDKP